VANRRSYTWEVCAFTCGQSFTETSTYRLGSPHIFKIPAQFPLSVSAVRKHIIQARASKEAAAVLETAVMCYFHVACRMWSSDIHITHMAALIQISMQDVHSGSAPDASIRVAGCSIVFQAHSGCRPPVQYTRCRRIGSRGARGCSVQSGFTAKSAATQLSVTAKEAAVRRCRGSVSATSGEQWLLPPAGPLEPLLGAESEGSRAQQQVPGGELQRVHGRALGAVASHQVPRGLRPPRGSARPVRAIAGTAAGGVGAPELDAAVRTPCDHQVPLD
jgi:hypothetical protein